MTTLTFTQKIEIIKETRSKVRKALNEIKKLGYTTAVLNKSHHFSNQFMWELFYQQTKTTSDTINNFIFTTKFDTSISGMTNTKYFMWRGDKNILLSIFKKYDLDVYCENQNAIVLKMF